MTKAKRLSMLSDQRAIYVTYLGARLAEQDWHGVRDIAADLECLDRERKALEWVPDAGE